MLRDKQFAVVRDYKMGERRVSQLFLLKIALNI